MLIAQRTIQAIVENMETTLRMGRGIAIKDIEGKVVSLPVSASGEREDWGLNDTYGTYFYFRLNAEEVPEPRAVGNQKYGSCSLQVEQRVPLRLVVQHPCKDPMVLLELAKRALYANDGIKIRGIDFVSIQPISTNSVSWQVYALETGKEAKTLSSLMQVVSINFNLVISYSPTNQCLDLGECL